MLSTTGETDIIISVELSQTLSTTFSHPPNIPPSCKKSLRNKGKWGGKRRKSKAIIWCRLKSDNFGVCCILRLLSWWKSPKLSNSGWILPEGGNDLKSPGGDTVRVRVPSTAPNKYNPNQIFRIGKGVGLFVYFTRYEQTYFANGWKIRPESKPRGPRKKKAR